MKNKSNQFIVSILTIAFVFWISTSAARANVFVVKQSGDAGDGTCDATCTLRDAVTNANNSPSDDAIEFDVSLIRITLTSEIEVTNNGSLEIRGRGAKFFTIDGGAGTNRIFYFNNALVTVTEMTLTGGDGTGAVGSNRGGAIYAAGGKVWLDRVHVTLNTVPSGATSAGGGVYLTGGTNNRITNSTFSGNESFNICGGLHNLGGTLSIANSTFYGNQSASSGGGLCSRGSTKLRNVTITGNTASSGGGFIHSLGALDFGNTIIAGNTAAIGREIYFSDGTIESLGGNLIGDAAGDAADTNLPVAYQSSDVLDMPPLLGAATTDNGGTTPTMALLAGSPAIDAGNNANAVDASTLEPLTVDQRGAARIIDAARFVVADIGAFEVQANPTAATVSVGGRVMTTAGKGIRNALVSLTDSTGATRWTQTNNFGFYRFSAIPSGETYIFSVYGKRLVFANPTQVINVVEDLSDINFVASEELFRGN